MAVTSKQIWNQTWTYIIWRFGGLKPFIVDELHLCNYVMVSMHILLSPCLARPQTCRNRHQSLSYQIRDVGLSTGTSRLCHYYLLFHCYWSRKSDSRLIYPFRSWQYHVRAAPLHRTKLNSSLVIRDIALSQPLITSQLPLNPQSGSLETRAQSAWYRCHWFLCDVQC